MATKRPLVYNADGSPEEIQSADSFGPLNGGLGIDASGVALGGLTAGTGAGTFGLLARGADGQFPTVDSTAPTGLRWTDLPSFSGGGSGGTFLYMTGTASDISTYNVSGDAPDGGAEVDASVSVASTDGEKLIVAFATPANYPNLTSILAGLWKFTFYSYIDSVVGVSNIVFRVYKRILAGTETEIFNVASSSITVSALGTGLEQVLNYTQATATTVLATDRIVVKVFAKTTSVVARTMHFVYDGSLHASNVLSPLVSDPIDVQGTPTANQFAIWVDAQTLQGHTLVAGDLPAIPESGVTGLVSDLALKAPLASPALTGIPLTPTAAPGATGNQIASVDFVGAAVAAASPLTAAPWLNSVLAYGGG